MFVDNSCNILIKLIHASFETEKDFSLPCNIDWQSVIDLSFNQGIAAIAVDGFQKVCEVRPGFGDNLESDSLENLKYEWFGSVFQAEDDYANQKVILSRLAKIISQKDISILLLKGLGLSNYYPIPEHRQVGDFDIYSYGHQLEVDSLVSEIGIEVYGKHPKHSIFMYQGVVVENHYLYLDSYVTKCERKVESFLESLDGDILKGGGYYTPSPLKNYLFLLCHMARHFSEYEGITLRHILDWGMFLKAEMCNLDLTLVMSKLREFGLERTNDLFVSLAERICGLDFSELLFERLPEDEYTKVLEYIVSEKKRELPRWFLPRFWYKLKLLYGNSWKFRYLSITMSERVWHSVKMHLLRKVEV